MSVRTATHAGPASKPKTAHAPVSTRASTHPSTRTAPAKNPTAAASQWTNDVYKEALGRKPTAEELASTLKRFAELTHSGLHPWAAGASIISDLKKTPDFAAANPHAAQIESAFHNLYKTEASPADFQHARSLIAQVEHNGGTAQQALAFMQGLMRNDPRYAHAHPFGAAVDKLFNDGLGRNPTADELKKCENFIGRSARGPHAGLRGIFEAGAALDRLMQMMPEFKRHNPLAAMFGKIYQANLGRNPSVEEIGKATRLSNDLAQQGKNIFDIARTVQFFIRIGDEYKRRVASLTPTLAAGGTPSPYIGRGNYLPGRGAPALRAAAQSIAARMGWNAAQFQAWDALINAESSWNPNAQNPTSTAYGLGQFLNSTWRGFGPKTSDPTRQLEYMARYIQQRYGDPLNALRFHATHNWY